MNPHTKPYKIVLGNEKGGTGKSTFAMHVIASLLHQNAKVGSIDLDARQGTLSRYLENRKKYQEKTGKEVLMPVHTRLAKSECPTIEESHSRDRQNLDTVLETMQDQDYVVIDTPGNDTFLSRTAHSHADTLITPLNDSFIDMDLLVRLDSVSTAVLQPSLYAEMVWEQRKARAIRDKGHIEWIVLRNRLSSVRTRNRAEMEKVLNLLAKRIGFRLYPGFGERVIFKELFLAGLTLLDLERAQVPMTFSHVTARQELRNLMLMIPKP